MTDLVFELIAFPLNLNGVDHSQPKGIRQARTSQRFLGIRYDTWRQILRRRSPSYLEPKSYIGSLSDAHMGQTICSSGHVQGMSTNAIMLFQDNGPA